LNHKKKKIRSVTLAVLIYSFLSLVALRSGQAQDCHGGPPPEKRGAGPYGPPPGGPPPGNQDDLHRPPPGPPDGTRSTMRGGLQLGPPGRWWDDPPFAQDLGLSAAQASRMDEIFQANRSTLLGLYRSLQREQATLEQLTTGIRLHEQEIFRQIDQVTRASAALEKANAHMLLQIREQMTDEQIERLDQHRPKPPS
jgi:Spy/CpxP family protein refolding chaperone